MKKNPNFEQAVGPSLVRIIDGEFSFGVGVLISRRLVLTCAHVVNRFLGLRESSPTQPEGSVSCDFPFMGRIPPIEAAVITWVAIEANGSGDIALLRLAEDPPGHCSPLRLIHVDDLSSHRITVLGFPDEAMIGGELVTGRLVGRNSAGLLQILDSNTSGPRILPGFSGSPVWDDDVGGPVGIVVSIVPGGQVFDDDKTAFAIPTKQIFDQLEAVKGGDSGFWIRPVELDFGLLSRASRAEGKIACSTASAELVRRPDKSPSVAIVKSGNNFLVYSRAAMSDEAVLIHGESSSASARIVTAIHQSTLRASWPIAIGRDIAADRLIKWAGRRGAPPNFFSQATLDVADASVARLKVTRVWETHESSCHRSVEVPQYPIYSGQLWTVKTAFTPWCNATWLGIEESSAIDIACSKCNRDNKVVCDLCGGSSTLKCPTRVQCSCLRGRRLERDWNSQDLEWRDCRRCNGRGSIICEVCSGRGLRACPKCAVGYINCDQCAGTGRFTEYTVGQIDRTIQETATYTTDDPRFGKVKDDEYELLEMQGADGLQLLPAELQPQLRTILEAEWDDGAKYEIMRRYELSVCPITSVKFHLRDGTREALLLPGRVLMSESWLPSAWREWTGSTLQRRLRRKKK